MFSSDYGYDFGLRQTKRKFLGKNSSPVIEKTVLLGAVDDGSSYVVSRHDYQLQSVKDSKEDFNSNVYGEEVSSLIAFNRTDLGLLSMLIFYCVDEVCLFSL